MRWDICDNNCEECQSFIADLETARSILINHISQNEGCAVQDVKNSMINDRLNYAKRVNLKVFQLKGDMCEKAQRLNYEVSAYYDATVNFSNYRKEPAQPPVQQE
ncbi:GSCOCG00009080001-RA-CDS [Cotesia congregata]|nr:GSCOCG00009080001-RA-CDS [Cotesia congregata]